MSSHNNIDQNLSFSFIIQIYNIIKTKSHIKKAELKKYGGKKKDYEEEEELMIKKMMLAKEPYTKTV